MKHAFWGWKTQFNHEAPSEIFDCMLAEFLLSQGKAVPTQEITLQLYGAKNLEELMEKQLVKFAAAPDLYEYYNSNELPLIPVLWKMEQAGILLNIKHLKTVGEEIDIAIIEIEKTLKKVAGFDINLRSPLQIGNFLAEKLQVPLKKTKTGKYATNETEISQYSDAYPFIQSLLQYRELTKLRSTYVETLIEKTSSESVIHTTYSQVAANTGRLSSLNPNLQNIPSSSGFGQKIKACFVARKGKVLLSFDYSQQELRILAHLSKESALIKAFQQQKDIHTSTAAEIFEVPYEDVTYEQRTAAKTINFGVIYGMSSFGMSAQLHIPIEAAHSFISTFYATYPRIREYYEHYLNQGKINGYVKTLLGRRRFVFERAGQETIDNATRRVLINYPVQGSAADLIKKAMIQIDNEVVTKNIDCQLLLQIHDDLVFEVTDDPAIIDEVVKKVKKILCSIYPLSVPIEADVKLGKNWGEMKLIEQKNS